MSAGDAFGLAISIAVLVYLVYALVARGAPLMTTLGWGQIASTPSC